MVKRRAQMKIQQMAFMLMAVVLFFILVGLFWLSVQYVNLHKEATRIEQEKAITVASVLGDSAEFVYKEYSIDTDKLIVLKEKQAYKDFWPFAYIEVRKAGKQAEENPVECTKENYPNCNLYTVYDKNKASTREAKSFVALCRRENLDNAIYEKCELGTLKIGYEVK